MNELKIQKRAEELQKECHAFCDEFIGKGKYEYQDMRDIWMLRKLAEMQLQIESLAWKEKE